MSDLERLIAQHSDTTRELVVALNELGDLRARLLRDQAQTWLHGSDMGVTERREAVRYANADIAAEIENQVATVDGLRATLDDLRLRYCYAAGAVVSVPT